LRAVDKQVRNPDHRAGLGQRAGQRRSQHPATTRQKRRLTFETELTQNVKHNLAFRLVAQYAPVPTATVNVIKRKSPVNRQRGIA
jgi:hypothetical protein